MVYKFNTYLCITCLTPITSNNQIAEKNYIPSAFTICWCLFFHFYTYCPCCIVDIFCKRLVGFFKWHFGYYIETNYKASYRLRLLKMWIFIIFNHWQCFNLNFFTIIYYINFIKLFTLAKRVFFITFNIALQLQIIASKEIVLQIGIDEKGIFEEIFDVLSRIVKGFFMRENSNSMCWLHRDEIMSVQKW